jgi:hypothetical protein
MRLHLTALDWVASVLIIIGALNWGSVGLFGVDFVTAIFGIPFARVIFTLVGLAGLYMIYGMTKLYRVEHAPVTEHRATD